MPSLRRVAVSLEYSSQSWMAIGLGSLLVLGSIKSWGQTGSGPLSQRSAIANVQGGLDWIQTIFFF